MTKKMNSNLAILYPFIFLIVAFGLYYVFREHFMPAYGGYKHDRRNDWQELQKKELQDKIRDNSDKNKHSSF